MYHVNYLCLAAPPFESWHIYFEPTRHETLAHVLMSRVEDGKVEKYM